MCIAYVQLGEGETPGGNDMLFVRWAIAILFLTVMVPAAYADVSEPKEALVEIFCDGVVRNDLPWNEVIETFSSRTRPLKSDFENEKWRLCRNRYEDDFAQGELLFDAREMVKKTLGALPETTQAQMQVQSVEEVTLEGYSTQTVKFQDFESSPVFGRNELEMRSKLYDSKWNEFLGRMMNRYIAEKSR